MSFLINPIAREILPEDLSGLRNFFMGTPESFEQKSTLSPEQQKLFKQLMAALQGQGAGGAFGSAADYYRGLLSDNSADIEAFAAPELRRFRQETMPGLAEQFAGFGAGSGLLGSSAFKNASAMASTDLGERLAAMRAQLRMQGAAGLSNLAQQGFQPIVQNIHRPRQPGFLESAAPAIGTAVGAAVGGPAGAAIGGGLGNLGQNYMQRFGTTSPYGQGG